MDEMREALELFVAEATDLLAEMETSLLALAEGGSLQGGAGAAGAGAGAAGDETLNAIFRAAHTIKGSAGIFGLDHIVSFTHEMEDVLDRVRSHDLPLSGELVSVLLPCRDHIVSMVEGVRVGEPGLTEAQASRGRALVERLGRVAGSVTAGPGPGNAGGVGAAADVLTAAGVGAAEGAEAAQGVGAGPVSDAGGRPLVARAPGTTVMHVSVRFGQDCLRQGMDPLAFIRYLATLGTITSLTTVDDFLPAAAAMDPEACYLTFQVSLETSVGEQAVSEVFEFVRDDSDIRILPDGSPQAAYEDLVASFAPHSARVEEILVRTGAYPTLATPSPALSPSPTPAHALSPAPAPALVAEGAKANGDEARTIRVDSARLDRLVDAVGELVIAGGGASLRAAQSGDEAVRAAMEDVMRLVEDVRDAALSLRMVPIGRTFSRFRRVVHDVSRQLGKEVNLVITGGETEVDKALVDLVADPLTHLVRNALDHGIEARHVRVAKGKDPRGTLRVNAFHESGSVVVEVSDDGAGIDTGRVVEKAKSCGLIPANAVLSDAEAYELIFRPGFSTASQVTDISGRGVGMDVVKRNVDALRGTVEVSSQLGTGTTMRIRLPLTLAIIDGFMVGAGEATFVVPLDRVLECVELPATSQQRDYMDLRGNVLPLARLRKFMAIDGSPPKRQSVVVVEDAGLRAGLVVDHLKGEHQTVIKPLGPLFSQVPGVGGSSILGNGELALVIDVPGLVRHVSAAHRWRERQPA